MGHFVHFNHFWLDRSLQSSHIHCFLIRSGPRYGLKGCIALGLHEESDGDPTLIVPCIGELFHLVVDRHSEGRGYGTAAIQCAITKIKELYPKIEKIRLSHHPENIVAAKLYEKFQIKVIGTKTDSETGINDILREMLIPEV
jgi:RimJ/RimL family protein N-acetyltransferase